MAADSISKQFEAYNPVDVGASPSYAWSKTTKAQCFVSKTSRRDAFKFVVLKNPAESLSLFPRGKTHGCPCVSF